MSSVALADVSKTYAGDVSVLSGFNLEVTDGEFLTIVGPSGSGKSTLLRLIAGLEKVSSGTIWFDDVNVTSLPPHVRKVSMVFQSAALYPNLSVRGNLSFPLEVQGMDSDQAAARVEAEARHLGILPLLDRMPDTLSAGQRHVVATGRALVHEASVLLMDEPLAQLDARSRERARAEISQLHQKIQVTTIYVTNDPTEALALGDRVAVINPEGALVQIDTPQRVFDQPRDVFVAQFLGLITVLPGRLSDGTWIMTGQLVDLGPALFKVRPELDDYSGRQVLVGARPPAIRAGGEPHSEPALRGEVTFVEHLGAGTLIHAETAGRSFIALGGPDEQARPGAEVTFTLDRDRLMFFDSVTRQLLSAPVGTVAGHCFVCDRPAKGPVCPQCGAATWVGEQPATDTVEDSLAPGTTLDDYLDVADPTIPVVRADVRDQEPGADHPAPVQRVPGRWLLVSLAIIVVIALAIILSGGWS